MYVQKLTYHYDTNDTYICVLSTVSHGLHIKVYDNVST